VQFVEISRQLLRCQRGFRRRLDFSAASADDMGDERRKTNRYPFDAAVDVTDEKSGGTLSMRISELGLNGCYLQTESPFPQGTSLSLKVFVDGDFFEARATVAYAQPKQGMGVAFRDLKPYFAGVLKKWLLSAMLANPKSRT
jgi:hypothetical protein